MSGNFLGMDVDAITTLKGTFLAKAGDLRTLSSALTTDINNNVNNTWKGNDATKFQSDWETHKKNLEAAAQALDDVANTVLEPQIQEQKNASGMA